MFHIALYQPEIPPNTGNIIRLCANTGAHLHVIHPLGFAPDDKQLRRAGLDYNDWASVQQYQDVAAFFKAFSGYRIFACSTKGSRAYSAATFKANDVFLFGPETRGLPADLLESFPPDHILKIPMLATSRSLNLSNAAAVIVYEAWRQLGFGRPEEGIHNMLS